MGSLDKAVITGFICRLCSKMNRFVVHIYGQEGVRLRLAEKINVYLPITISVNDPLPKTVCIPCIQRLETHHELMKQFTLARTRLIEVSKSEAPSASNGAPPVRRRFIHPMALWHPVPLSQPSTSHANNTPRRE